LGLCSSGAIGLRLSSVACKFLTVLMVAITGIPSPDVQVDYQDTRIALGTPLHFGTIEESRIIQRAVFRQLGSLVCLRELVLRAEGSNEHLVLDCTGLTPVFYDTTFSINMFGDDAGEWVGFTFWTGVPSTTGCFEHGT